jgi:hypothetical protein
MPPSAVGPIDDGLNEGAVFEMTSSVTKTKKEMN